MTKRELEEVLQLSWQVPVGRASSNEHYPTPRWCTKALLLHLESQGYERPSAVLDPCCGEGMILSEVRHRWGLPTLGIELDAVRAEAARQHNGEHDRIEVGDALRLPWPAGAIITNPPYTLAWEFVWKAVEQVETGFAPFAAFLLRSSWLEPANGRLSLFQRSPPDVLVLPRRPAFDGKGTDSVPSYWYLWPGTGVAGGTLLRWLPP